MGWWRESKTVNSPSLYIDNDENWGTFLTATLGLQLALDNASADGRIVRKVEADLAASRADTGGGGEAFSTYLQRFGVVRDTKVGKREFDLALAILASPQFPPPPQPYLVVRYAENYEPMETRERLTGVFFARAQALDKPGLTTSASHAKLR